jgi:hypothetical protein
MQCTCCVGRPRGQKISCINSMMELHYNKNSTSGSLEGSGHGAPSISAAAAAHQTTRKGETVGYLQPDICTGLSLLMTRDCFDGYAPPLSLSLCVCCVCVCVCVCVGVHGWDFPVLRLLKSPVFPSVVINWLFSPFSLSW